MRVAVVAGKKRFVIKNVPDPVLDKDEVMIKVQYCGICGSDFHIFKTGADISAGHEFSGDIVEVGSDVEGWAVGDRVVVGPSTMCGVCFWCRRGEIELCEQSDEEMLEYKGAFATYAKAKYTRLRKLSDDLSYEQAALVEPTSCALHAIRKSRMEEGDVVAVLGLGPIGQLVARVAKALGAKAVYAAEISPSRIELARGMVDEIIDANATNPVDRILELTHGMGPDVVIECAGSVSTTQQSIALVRKGGTIVIAGICFDWVEIPVSNVLLRELTIKGSLACPMAEYASALELIKERKIDVSPLVTCKMPLDDINEAFEKGLRAEGGKILIKP